MSRDPNSWARVGKRLPWLLSVITSAVSLTGCSQNSVGPVVLVGPALRIPAKILVPCPSGRPGLCYEEVPADLRTRQMELPRLGPGAACPGSSGVSLALPNTAGTGVGQAPVWAIIPQAGDLVHGIVTLGKSNVSGWLGIKTHWTVSPSYQGWIIIRAEQLGGSGPVALLGDATIGPLLIPPGAGPNDAGGWRERPSGTYVKGPGCYGFQVDGASFTENIIVEAMGPTR